MLRTWGRKITISGGYRFIILLADIMFVNKIPSLLTISRHVHYVTTGKVQSTKMCHLAHEFGRIRKLYGLNGFVTKHLFVDGQFGALRPYLPGIDINPTPANAHVSEAERAIRVHKERCRCDVAMVPPNKSPAAVVGGLVNRATF